MAEILSIDAFRAALKGGGARPNKFQVIPTWPGILAAQANIFTARFMIKAAQLPGQTINLVEPKYMGRSLKLPGDRTFEDWTITVINDTTFDVRNSFERWSNIINSHSGNAMSMAAAAPAAYMSDWLLQHLDQKGNIVAQYNMKGCWPQQVGSIDLGWEQGDEIESFTVTMSYQYWTNLSSTDL
jgi:hypothetical protein